MSRGRRPGRSRRLPRNCAATRASTISRINKSLDGVLRRFAPRRLDEAYPYVILDARYEKVRLDEVVQSQAVFLAIGINGEGRRQLLGVELSNRESSSSWTAFIKGLKTRGLHGVEFVVSDDHAGLKKAVRELLPEAVWQLLRALPPQRAGLSSTQSRRRSPAGAPLALWPARNLKEAQQDLQAWLKRWEQRYPKLTDWVETHIGETLNFYSYLGSLPLFQFLNASGQLLPCLEEHRVDVAALDLINFGVHQGGIDLSDRPPWYWEWNRPMIRGQKTGLSKRAELSVAIGLERHFDSYAVGKFMRWRRASTRASEPSCGASAIEKPRDRSADLWQNTSSSGSEDYPREVHVQISESHLHSGGSVRSKPALVCLITLVLGMAGADALVQCAEEVVQSCRDLPEPQDRAVISSPAQVPSVYLARLNEGNREGVSDLFATDAVHRGPDGQVRRGRAAIRQFYLGNAGGGPRKFAVGRSVADGHRVAFELINLLQPCNEDDPALVVDVMDINEEGQIQEFTVFLRPRPR